MSFACSRSILRQNAVSTQGKISSDIISSSLNSYYEKYKIRKIHFKSDIKNIARFERTP